VRLVKAPTVAAVMMVRDEADIIGFTLAHLLAEGVDHVLVADNMSVDDTRRILDLFAEDERVTVVDDLEPGYHQDVKMTNLAREAHTRWGVDWILPCDADEVFYSRHGTLAEFFATCDADVLTATGWDHLVTDDDDPGIANPFLRSPRRRQTPQKLGKVAFRFHPDARLDFGNHFVFDHPGQPARVLNYRHLQYRSFDQMCQKVQNGKEAYDATNLHPTYGAHWRELGALTDDALWRRWRRLCEEPGLLTDPVPCR
jgi:glycosyltransferase involved in cell wall biosynthesis